jgi:hypothetical protein
MEIPTLEEILLPLKVVVFGAGIYPEGDSWTDPNQM